jgi:hypothetical protein
MVEGISLLADRLGQSEIYQLHLIALGKDYVFRLDVSMYDTVAVRVSEGVCYLDSVFQRFFYGQ